MNICVVMPAYGEAIGIQEFVLELSTELMPTWEVTFIIVDDCSVDETFQAASDLRHSGLHMVVFRNEVNLGHGPSTLRALALALEEEAEFIVAVDGDGQFRGADLKCLVKELESSEELVVIEGVRVGRNEPLFRRLTSFATRLLVMVHAGAIPRDANTPLRAYRRQFLSEILTVIPPNAMTPNLLISSLSRKWEVGLREIEVKSLPRRGGDEAGTTWRARHHHLPSRRFVQFCASSIKQWFALTIRQGPSAR